MEVEDIASRAEIDQARTVKMELAGQNVVVAGCWQWLELDLVQPNVAEGLGQQQQGNKACMEQ